MEVPRLRNRDKKGEREMDTCTVTAKCTSSQRGYFYFAGGASPPRGNEVLLGSTLPSRTTYQSAKVTYRLSVMP